MPKHFAEKYIPCRIFIRQGFSFAEKSCKIKHKNVSFGFTRNPNLFLPLGEMSRSDREGWVLLLRAVQTCLSLWERCRAATERACISYILSPVCPDANWFACCPLSHLLRKCQLSQRESREAGASCTPDASGYLLRKPVSVLLLPSRLAPCHLPQRGRLFSYYFVVSASVMLVSSSCCTP